jgi:probable rRNA maturation factor
MFSVEVQNDDEYPVNAERLQHAALTVLARQQAQPGAEMTIVITDNEAVAALNNEFRGIDAPTDVLSFPADAPPFPMPDEPPYLGDLVIAYPYAASQAEREGHPVDDSFALLVIHGTLHLLGYDHNTPENRAVMWQLQDALLAELHISLDLVPALEVDDDETHA